MRPMFIVAHAVVLGAAAEASPIIVDFDDLPAETFISGTTYKGLTWEFGNAGLEGNPGVWSTAPASLLQNYPHSSPRNIINAWGARLMGISFPNPVTVVGAYFAAVGDPPQWNPWIQVHGYRDGLSVGNTGRFGGLTDQAAWFQMDLVNVDRIVIECDWTILSLEGWTAGWYGMDDLTYVPEPAALVLLATGGLLFCTRRGTSSSQRRSSR